MTTLSSRLVTFGGAGIHLEYTQGRAADITRFLLRGVAADETVLPHVSIRLTEEPNDGQFTISVAGEASFRGESPGAVATWLIHAICRELAGESRTGLVLHSAAVTSSDVCILLPGPTGAGKTTLTTFLSARGFGYLSDELVFVPLGRLDVEALTRPLKIRRAALGMLETYLQPGGGRETQLESPAGVLEPVPASAPSGRLPRTALAAIVFSRYDQDATFRLEPMSPARTGLRLMECLLNARNLTNHGFDEVVRVARAVPAYSMCYASFEQLESNLDALRAGSLRRGIS